MNLFFWKYLFISSIFILSFIQKRGDSKKELWSWKRVFLLIRRTKLRRNILKKFKKNMKKNKKCYIQSKQSHSISIGKSWRWRILLRWISTLKIISISLLGNQILTILLDFTNNSFRFQTQILVILLMSYRLKEGFLLRHNHPQIWIKRELMSSSLEKMLPKNKETLQALLQSQGRKERKTRKIKTKAVVVMQTWRRTKKPKKEDEK